MEKVVVYVCVGSSCHLKGSHKVVKLMREAIAARKLEEKIELKATFCLGNCTNGVSARVGDNPVFGIKEENFNEVFEKEVLSKVL